MNYWLARSGEVFGPYESPQLNEMLAGGELHDDDHLCRVGEDNWMELKEWLQQHPRAHAEVSTAKDYSVPPTQKQRVLLEFVESSVPQTKQEATALIDSITKNTAFEAKLAEWVHARLELYPDLYAAERQKRDQGYTSFRQERARSIRDVVNDDADAEFNHFKRINLKEAQEVVDYLDSLSPDWDLGKWREPVPMWNANLFDKIIGRAIALKFPAKVKKRWAFLFEL